MTMARAETVFAGISMSGDGMFDASPRKTIKKEDTSALRLKPDPEGLAEGDFSALADPEAGASAPCLPPAVAAAMADDLPNLFDQYSVNSLSAVRQAFLPSSHCNACDHALAYLQMSRDAWSSFNIGRGWHRNYVDECQ